MGLLKKKIEDNATSEAFKKLEFISVNDQKEVLKLADKIMYGIPICLNFEGCIIATANEMISFLAGVIYACDGEIVTLRKDIFLFAQKSDIKDGSLKKFIDQYQG